MATADVSWLQALPVIEGSVGLAAEADSAFALTGDQSTVAHVSWLQVQPLVSSAPGLATETDTAFALESSAAGTVTADVAWLQVQPLSAGIGLSVETSTAFALTSTTAGVTAQVSWLQVQEAGPDAIDPRVAGVWTPAIRGRWRLLDDGGGIKASERSTAFKLEVGLAGSVALATETDTAFALTSSAVSVGNVGLAGDTHTAFALVGISIGEVGLAGELSTALLPYVDPVIGNWLAVDVSRALALSPVQDRATSSTRKSIYAPMLRAALFSEKRKTI